MSDTADTNVQVQPNTFEEFLSLSDGIIMLGHWDFQAFEPNELQQQESSIKLFVERYYEILQKHNVTRLFFPEFLYQDENDENLGFYKSGGKTIVSDVYQFLKSIELSKNTNTSSSPFKIVISGTEYRGKISNDLSVETNYGVEDAKIRIKSYNTGASAIVQYEMAKINSNSDNTRGKQKFIWFLNVKNMLYGSQEDREMYGEPYVGPNVPFIYFTYVGDAISFDSFDYISKLLMDGDDSSLVYENVPRLTLYLESKSEVNIFNRDTLPLEEKDYHILKDSAQTTLMKVYEQEEKLTGFLNLLSNISEILEPYRNVVYQDQ